MSDLERIANELIENGKTVSYYCRFILDVTFEQAIYLYNDDLYMVTYVANKPVNVVLK